MADLRITVMGESGCGKTALLLSLYNKMVSGVNGFHLLTDDITDVQLRERYSVLENLSNKKTQAIKETTSVEEYKFTLRRGTDKVVSFDLIDYPGRVFTRKSCENDKKFKNIKFHVLKSNFLIVCINGEYLVGEDIDEKIEKVKKNVSSVVNTYLAAYSIENNCVAPITFLVTKYDICNRDTDEEEIVLIIKRSFSPLFTDSNSTKIFSIIPVSTVENTDSNFIFDIGHNVVMPIYMSAWMYLCKIIRDERENFNEKIEFHKSKISKYEKIKNDEEKSWFFKDKNKIKKYADMIGYEEKKLGAILNNKKYLENVICVNRDMLSHELKDLKNVYVDGVKVPL